jgi:hypothetical protein
MAKRVLVQADGKLRFEYHKQSLEYNSNILDTPSEAKTIDPIDQKTIDQKTIDQNLNSNALNSSDDGRS